MSLGQKKFGILPDGTRVDLFTLQNASGMKMEVIPYGCRIVSLWVPDKHGKSENVVLGHDTLEEYLLPGDYLGCVVGRYANRIAGAEFTLNGTSYTLAKNDGENHLHGGPTGFSNRVWRLRCSNHDDDAPSITFQYISKDGEEGYPGNVTVDVTYTLTTDNALIIDYKAKSDVDTILNLTNHSFFNISGDFRKEVLPQILQIQADYITEARADLIPTGELMPVQDTPYDFIVPKTIGQDIKANEALLKSCGGYDHNYVIAGESEHTTGVRKAAQIYDEASGRTMLVFTDMPGMQLYTANGFPKNYFAQGGIPILPHHAVCFETQYYPDSIHHENFPSPVLKAGEIKKSTTIYKFEIIK